jgi:hypothetical protein
MVVELPKMTNEDFIQRLDNLPEISLWHQGMHSGAVVSQRAYPTLILPVPDEKSNPAQFPKFWTMQQSSQITMTLLRTARTIFRRDGKFYPGAILGSNASTGSNQRNVDSTVSAGILVEKDGRKRLTCSFHAWEEQHKAHPGAFRRNDAASRDIFQVVQGMADDCQPGTSVGWVCKRFGDSDIAPAQLDDGINFENQFFAGLDTSPKVLLRSEDIRQGDDFLVVNFTAGRVRLRCAGTWIWHTISQGKAEVIAPTGKSIWSIYLSWIRGTRADGGLHHLQTDHTHHQQE